MTLEFMGRFLDAAFQWTWEASCAGAVLVVLVMVLQRLFGKLLGVRGSYLLSLLVLVRLLWPIAPTSPWSWLSLGGHVHGRGETIGTIQPALTEVAAELGSAVDERALLESPPARRSVLPLRSILEGIWITGVLGLLGIVGWKQRRFAKWVRTQDEVADGPLLSWLADARSRMRVGGKVGLILTPRGPSPALFGWRKPRLLLPNQLCANLTECELRMVLLHELAHVKRRDVLQNWLMILVRSLHWFNPLVWAALRRLRADRELVCDAMVLNVLEKREHREYGATLIRLMDLLSTPASCPSLVPLLNHNTEIKRRIRMIPNFAPTGRTALALTGTLTLILCALTFTRAADQRKREPTTMSEVSAAKQAVPGAKSDQTEHLKARFDELENRIRDQQQMVDKLRLELAIPSDVADGQARSFSDPETVRLTERERIVAEAQAARYQTLLKELKSRNPTQLAQSVPTAIPDAELTQLLRDLNSAEAQRARLSQNFGPEHTEVKTAETMIKTVKQQIDARVEGILDGLAAQVAAQLASADSLRKQSIDLAQRDAELATKYRPYFQAKRDLAILERVRDSLMVQIVERQFGPQPEAPENK